MTPEEYRSRTKILSVNDAKKRLVWLRAWFAIVAIVNTIGGIGARVLEGANVFWLSLIQITAFISFIIYCRKIIKLTENVTKANIIWSILFAPLSWIWFYPAITMPLRIIIGEISPPENLVSSEEKRQARERVNKSYRSTMMAVAIVATLWFLVFGGYIVYQIKK